ncbi:MAG: LacI family DNA-binding transcriptional regulator [Victivallales bacterium]|nr:LacI family DNA-binding transcriptional regulator [Victivallales bacterium]
MSDVTSMNDIAVALGLSRTTVSLCLSGKAEKYKIPPETVSRVKSFAAESGFVPNAMAQSIGSAKTRSVGFLLGIDSFTSKNQSLMRYAIREFSERGWNYHVSHFGIDEFGAAFLRMKGLGVSAVLALGSLSMARRAYEEIAAYLKDLPLYLLDYPFTNVKEPSFPNVYRIGIERVSAYRAAFKKLFDMGHRRCLLDDNDAKITAIKDVVESDSLLFDENCVIHTPQSSFDSPFACGLEMAKEILGKLNSMNATAVSLHDDELAAGVISALLDAGVSIPGDVSIFGFDNIEAAAHFRVPLSSIEVPTREMVSLTANAVCGEKKLNGDVVLPGRLIMRASISKRDGGEAETRGAFENQ